MVRAEYSGNGTQGDPFIITTPAQLSAVRNALDAHYRLACDIDLTAYLAPGGAGHAQWTDDGWLPIADYWPARFIGSFDGEGHKITGLWLARSLNDSVGLFGFTDGANIRNLGVEISAEGVVGNTSVGGLVGTSFNSSITNCCVDGDVDGESLVGGLMGTSFNSGVTNCRAEGRVTAGSGRGGGLAGVSTNSRITNCNAAGSVSGDKDLGGLVGVSTNSRVTNCYAACGVTATGGFAGGLLGAQFDSRIANSYATGDVSGEYNVGGLVGGQNSSLGFVNSISNSYASGNVSGNKNIGGLVGGQLGVNTIANSYRWQFATVTEDGALPSINNDPNGRHGGTVTASELTDRTTYKDWAFSGSAWHWDDAGFPKLNIGVETFPFRFIAVNV